MFMTFTTLLSVVFVMGTATATPLFMDGECAGGFRLSNVDSSMRPVEVGTVLSQDPGQTPQWRLAQWGTRLTLESAPVQRDEDGTLRLSNAGKEVKLFPGGPAGGGIILAVNGGAEYEGRLRHKGESWPHLLIEQRLDAIPVNAHARMDFTVAFKVLFCRSAVDAPLDPNLHTAHINAFWTVHNMNAASKDHRDMIWFGLPLYDARHPIPPGHQALDIGKGDASGKFICTIEGARFYDKAVDIGKWHHLQCDIVPLIKEALAIAQQHGFLTHTKKEELALTSFNLGWEVPGPYNCAIHLRELKWEASGAAE